MLGIPSISSIEERIIEKSVIKDMGIIPGSYEEGIRNCYDSNISEMVCPNNIITRIPVAPLKGDCYLIDNARLEIEFKINPANFILNSAVVGAAANTSFIDIVVGWEVAGMIIDQCVKLLIDNSEVYTYATGSVAAITKMVYASLGAHVTRNSLTAINVEDILAGKPLPPCMKRFTMKRIGGTSLFENCNPAGALNGSFSPEDLTFKFHIDLSQWLPIFGTLPPITKNVGNLTFQFEIRNPLSTMTWATIDARRNVINFVPIDKPQQVYFTEKITTTGSTAVLLAATSYGKIGFQTVNAVFVGDGASKVGNIWNVTTNDAWRFTVFRLIQTTFKLKNPMAIESALQRGLSVPMTHITDHTFNNNTSYGPAGSYATLETKVNAYAVKALVLTFPYFRELRHWLPNLEFKNLTASYGGQTIYQEPFTSINDIRYVNYALNTFTNTDEVEPNPNYRLSFNNINDLGTNNLFVDHGLLKPTYDANGLTLLNGYTISNHKNIFTNCTFLPIDFSELGDFRGGLNSSNYIATDFRVNFNSASADRFGVITAANTKNINVWNSYAGYGDINNTATLPIIYALEHIYLNYVWENGSLRKIIMDKSAPQTQ